MKQLLFFMLAFFVLFFFLPGMGSGSGRLCGLGHLPGLPRRPGKAHEQEPSLEEGGPRHPFNRKGVRPATAPGLPMRRQAAARASVGSPPSAKGARRRKSAVCLTCHENSTQLALWDSGVHKKQDVACSDCHTLHGPPKTPAGYGTTLEGLGYTPSWQYAGLPQVPPRQKSPVQQKVSPSPHRRKDHVLRLP